MSPTLYILYNADASILGKLHYGVRKMTSTKDKSPCAACDITHGGLSLSETEGWKGVRGELEKEGWRVVQWHRDEVGDEVGFLRFVFWFLRVKCSW